MKVGFLAAATALALLATPANAVNFTLSGAFGTGNFGSITGAFIDPANTIALMHVSVSPNYVLDTGNGHLSFALSLGGSGFISGVGQNSATALAQLNGTCGTACQAADPFTVLAHTTPAPYVNQPFQNFTDAIAGNCGSGASSGGCGPDLWFTISNFGGFLPATSMFDPDNGGPLAPVNVFAAVDIYNLVAGSTGAVGLAAGPTPTPFVAVPGPIAGAGLPGAIMALLGMIGLGRRRQNRQAISA